MAKAAQDPPAEVLLEQSRTVLVARAAPSTDAFAAPSVLAGWRCAELAGHLVFAHRTLRESLGRPTRQPRAADPPTMSRAIGPTPTQISDGQPGGRGGAGTACVEQLDAETVADCATALADLDRHDRGARPAGPDHRRRTCRTRIVELVVHSDDLNRSLPEQPAGRAAARRPRPLRPGRSPPSWPGSTRAARSRSGCRRTPRCSARSRATPGPPTPAAPRPTWWRPTR